MLSSIWMLKLGFLTITGCFFWNIFFPPRVGGLGPKICVGHTKYYRVHLFLPTKGKTAITTPKSNEGKITWRKCKIIFFVLGQPSYLSFSKGVYRGAEPCLRFSYWKVCLYSCYEKKLKLTSVDVSDITGLK